MPKIRDDTPEMPFFIAAQGILPKNPEDNKMSWYKEIIATNFVDSAIVSSMTESSATLVISGKRYFYSGYSGYAINTQVVKLQKMKNKFKAGQLLSNYLKSIEQFRIKPS